MSPSCSFRRTATDSGRTFSSSRSDFAFSSSSAASARSRARTKYWSSANAVVATPRTFSTKSVTTTPPGMAGARAAKAGSIAPDTATSPTKAANHGTACRAPTNSRALKGDVTAHNATAEEVAEATEAPLQRKRQEQAHPQLAASE